ncbi:MAG: TlpA family protein disulfide reductase [Nitrospiria bacterium]
MKILESARNIFCVIILLFGSLGPVEATQVPQTAADFTVKSLGGENIKLSEQRGRVVILNFWATWCAPCKKELPYFNELYGKYKHVGLEILGVNIDKTRSEAVRMTRTMGLDFPVLLDPSGTISGLYRIRSMPTTYIVAKDGTIRHIHWGFGPNEPARYEKEVRSLLKE